MAGESVAGVTAVISQVNGPQLVSKPTLGASKFDQDRMAEVSCKLYVSEGFLNLFEFMLNVSVPQLSPKFTV